MINPYVFQHMAFFEQAIYLLHYRPLLIPLLHLSRVAPWMDRSYLLSTREFDRHLLRFLAFSASFSRRNLFLMILSSLLISDTPLVFWSVCQKCQIYPYRLKVWVWPRMLLKFLSKRSSRVHRHGMNSRWKSWEKADTGKGQIFSRNGYKVLSNTCYVSSNLASACLTSFAALITFSHKGCAMISSS